MNANRGDSGVEGGKKLCYYLVIFYLLIDFARIQDIIPFPFRPGLFVIISMSIFVVFHNLYFFKDKQIKLIWLFFLLLSLYIPFCTNTFKAYTTAKAILMYMPYILSVIYCIDSIERLKKFMTVQVLIMIYVAISGLLNKGIGTGGYFSDENDLSLYINLMLPTCYFLFFFARKKLEKLMYGAGVIFGLASVILSFSRGGFVGLVAIAFVIWLFSPKKMMSLTVLVVLSVLIFLISGDSYLVEMSTVTDTRESTAQWRLMAWASGWRMFIDNPLGVGGSNFPYRFPEYQPEGLSRLMGGRPAHSLWFTLFPEVGIFGTLLYFILMFRNYKDLKMVSVLLRSEQSDKRYLGFLAIATIAGFAGFFTSGTFLSVLYYPYFWYMTALVVVIRRITLAYDL